MKSLFVICLLLVLSGTAVSLIREYIYLSEQMNWTAAQNYCRQHYGDLASITTEEENQRAVKTTGENSFWVWIGLNRTEQHVNIWQWSGGERFNFTKWNSGEPDDQGTGEECAASTPYGWIDNGCIQDLPFICYRRFMLVKENKTWDEALKHCRMHYGYLAFVDSETLLDLLIIETGQAQTASVWTGLRFLNGKWFWVNRGLLRSPVSLPSCPVQPYRCGAYNFKTYIWENRNCNEKLNFLCYY